MPTHTLTPVAIITSPLLPWKLLYNNIRAAFYTCTRAVSKRLLVTDEPVEVARLSINLLIIVLEELIERTPNS